MGCAAQEIHEKSLYLPLNATVNLNSKKKKKGFINFFYFSVIASRIS